MAPIDSPDFLDDMGTGDERPNLDGHGNPVLEVDVDDYFDLVEGLEDSWCPAVMRDTYVVVYGSTQL